jgi:hypothetical protein
MSSIASNYIQRSIHYQLRLQIMSINSKIDQSKIQIELIEN